jgi:hypothetical protein
VAQHFDEAHHRELLGVLDELHARVAHLIATDADEPVWRVALAQRPGDTGRMQVTGRLAGDE